MNKILSLTVLILYFHTSFAAANLAPMQKAEAFFDAALYAEAVPLFQKALQESLDTDPSLAESVRLKLAHAYFSSDRLDEAALSLQENLTLSEPKLMGASLYLSAMIARSKKEYEHAISLFKRYLDLEPTILDFHEEALFELGLSCYQLGDFLESFQFFDRLYHEAKKSRLKTLACFYLARIHLAQNHLEAAEQILHVALKDIDREDPLRFEASYLLGETRFHQQDYAQAVALFDKALPEVSHPDHCPWYGEALFQLGWAHLNLGMRESRGEEQKKQLQKSVAAFQKLASFDSGEKVYLALGQAYLASANLFETKEAYERAEEILSQPQNFKTHEAKAQALLLRAQAAPTYAERDKFYRQLTQDVNQDTLLFARSWFMCGLNDYEEGHELLGKGNKNAYQMFERAANSFEKGVFHLKQAGQKKQAGLALKYQALALSAHFSPSVKAKGFRLLESMDPEILQLMENPDEIFYMRALLAMQLAEEDEMYSGLAEQSLAEGIAQYPRGKFASLIWNILGSLHYLKERFLAAEEAYLQILRDFPQSPLAGEALYWAANCADKMGCEPEIGRQRRMAVFEFYRNCPYAADAYFNCYSYRDYVQGNRIALRHLQNMKEVFPDVPHLVQVHYLLGLDNKRDRKTTDGKLRKKNLTAAIDAFHQAETTFDQLHEQGRIPEGEMALYLNIRYRAALERGLANLAIAEESQGAKKQIYLEYAEELFRNLVTDFEKPDRPLIKQLVGDDPFFPLHEENCYWLAQTYLKNYNQAAAEKVFSQMLERYKIAKITRGYFLSRVWYEQGMLATQKGDHALALQCLKHSEDAAKGKGILSTDQRLDLWIQQSLCYKEMNHLESAILLLSKVVNDDAISGLRLKAMYLRGEIYALQGRHEVARKQLESMVKKGGEWALRAKEKLRNEYGY